MNRILEALSREGKYYEEFHRTPGWGRGPCTAVLLIKEEAGIGGPYRVSLFEEDGNYAGGESMVKYFDFFENAVEYAEKLKKEYLKKV